MSEPFEDLCPDTQAAYSRMERALGVEKPQITAVTSAEVDASVRLRQMRKILDTIMMAWAKAPALRLGQLLENSVGRYFECDQRDSMFYIEDEALTAAVCRFELEFLCGTGSSTKPSEQPSV